MIEIYTLGTFALVVDGKVITDSAGRTQKLWKLLNLLVSNRGTPLSIPAIIESIWPDEEKENCTKALHNLIFRLRKILGKTPGGKVTIQYLHNSYCLHMGENFYVDAHEFEDCYLQATRSYATPAEKAQLLEKALSLYKGKYLMDSYDETWAMTLSSKYRRIYIEAVLALSDIGIHHKAYEKVMQICESAISLEPLEESIYERLIRCMQLNGQKIRAIATCEGLFELLYRELGVSATDSIHQLYRELKENVIHSQHNMVSILNVFAEENTEKRAFACGIETFKSIYRYEVRQSVRRRESIFLALLSITDKNRSIPSSHTLANAKPSLFESCLRALRYGDVISSYSSSQIVVLLARFSHEDGHVVLERIQKKFNQLYPFQDVLIEFETKPMRVEVLLENIS